MKRTQRFFILFILINLIFSNIFAQENSNEGTWTINIIKGSKNKVGKIFKGPFSDKDTLIANWYYYDIPQNKKYGIVKNSTYVTKTPKAFYRSSWDEITGEFDTNREAAITKYKIVKDKKIEKKYAKLTKKNNKKGEKHVESAPIVVEPTKSIEEEIITPVIEEPQEEIITEPETTEEIIEEQEPEEQIKEEPEDSEEEINFSQMINNITNNPVQRFSREYIQDYIKPEKVPQPKDEPSSLTTIENPDEADNFGQTLLMKAAKNGNDWQIKALINSGANVNLQDKDGWTALMYAVRYQESLNTINLLLNAKADVKIKNKYDSSAIIIAACYNNNPELIKTLLNYYSISDKEILKSFVLLLSTKHSSEYIQVAKINIFLDKSIPLNNFYEGKTPLMYCAKSSNSTTILKLLIDNGAKTSIRSTDGKTAFDYASENKNLTHDEVYWSLNK